MVLQIVGCLVLLVSLTVRAAGASGPIPAGQSRPRIELDPVCQQMKAPNPQLPPGNPAPSTRRMVARLQELYARVPHDGAAFLSSKMAADFRRELDQNTNLQTRFQSAFGLGSSLIVSGRPDEALNTFNLVEEMIEQTGGTMDKEMNAALRMRRGMAYFRLGEQENCLVIPAAEACIFPLRPAAQHRLPRGSRAAIEHFTGHLDEFPRDLAIRWLLNIAHMTLGEYPDKVDPKHLIPPDRFASEYPMPVWSDISEAVGLDFNDLAGGIIVDDFTNDGLYDIITSAWDFEGQTRLFINQGGGKFLERTSEAGLVGETGALNISQTDYNNDGWLDLWLMRGGWLSKHGRLPCSLLRNNRDGTFTDVTEEAGLYRLHPTMATRWFDYDGDGWLDVFLGNESLDPADPDRCELFHNNRDGTFTECGESSGVNVALFVKGVACADFDNDGRPDLYLSTGDGRNLLFRNAGPADPANPKPTEWRFINATMEAGLGAPIQRCFGSFAFDYNNDGWQDIVAFGYEAPRGVSEIAADYLGWEHRGAKTRLFRNDGAGKFTDVSKEARLDRIIHTMGHNYGDLENDGWLDFYSGTGDPDFRMLIPNRMFRNHRGQYFQEVTTATGTGHLQKGHAVTFADLDDDGDQDIYASLGGAFSGDFARNALFLNPASGTNNWLKLKLVGQKANKAAIGARLKLTLKGPDGMRELHRVVSSGGSFGSSPLRQEIGLGGASNVVSLEVIWPGSGTRTVLSNLKPNQAYQLEEGQEQARVIPTQPVDYARFVRQSPLPAPVRRDPSGGGN